MSQTERIIFIARTIEERGGITTQHIVDRFEISRRQVLRDIEYLRSRFDAPITYNPRKRHYSYEGSFSLDGSTNERVLVTGALFEELAKNQELDPFITTLVKQQLGTLLETEYHALTDKIIYLSDRSAPPNYELFSLICSALIKMARLSMRYRSTKGEERKRKVEPLRLISYTGIWYLVAYDVQRQDLRTFHLGRISELTVIEEDRFTERYSTEELDHYIKGGYGIFLGSETNLCSFLAKGWAQEVLSSEQLHPSQTLKKTNEGTIITIQTANLEELISLLLSYGANVTPLSPPLLVNRYTETLEAMRQNLL